MIQKNRNLLTTIVVISEHLRINKKNQNFKVKKFLKITDENIHPWW